MTKTHKTCNAPFGGTIAVHIVTFEVFLEEEKAPANLMDPDVQNHRNLSSYLNVLGFRSSVVKDCGFEINEIEEDSRYGSGFCFYFCSCETTELLFW